MNFQNVQMNHTVVVKVFPAGAEDDINIVAQHNVAPGANQVIPLAPGNYYVEVRVAAPPGGEPIIPAAVLNNVNANAAVTCGFAGGQLDLN